MDITLYQYQPTRSQRVRWTLDELELPYKDVEGRELIGSDELKKINPLGKVPAVVIDGKPLIESCAICTYLADATPEKKLIARSGTWERALHDQWVCFTLAEVEAWLWSSAKHTFLYPEEKRIAEIIAPNSKEAMKGLAVFNDTLSSSDYLVGNAFSVTDIIAGFALNWARMSGLTKDFAAVSSYLERLFERPLCPLKRPE